MYLQPDLIIMQLLCVMSLVPYVKYILVGTCKTLLAHRNKIHTCTKKINELNKIYKIFLKIFEIFLKIFKIFLKIFEIFLKIQLSVGEPS